MTYLKDGIGGSNGGKGRTEGTEELKDASKAKRRRQSRRVTTAMMKDVAEGLGMTFVRGAMGGRYIE